MYSEKLDEPIHSGRADWLSANPERGISLVSQAIRIFPRAHARGKGGGGREGKIYVW